MANAAFPAPDQDHVCGIGSPKQRSDGLPRGLGIARIERAVDRRGIVSADRADSSHLKAFRRRAIKYCTGDLRRRWQRRGALDQRHCLIGVRNWSGPAQGVGGSHPSSPTSATFRYPALRSMFITRISSP